MFELFYIKHLFKTSIKRKHKEIVNTKSIITMEGFRGHIHFQLKNSVDRKPTVNQEDPAGESIC